MKLVIDASVTLKWLLRDAPDEPDVPIALAILTECGAGLHELLQPAHWLAEVMAVLARRAPTEISDGLKFLRRIRPRFEESDAVYERAAELSHRLKHHLFDTLYHAVALEHGATLITADERYFHVAKSEGSIQRLHDFHSM